MYLFTSHVTFPKAALIDAAAAALASELRPVVNSTIGLLSIPSATWVSAEYKSVACIVTEWKPWIASTFLEPAATDRPSTCTRPPWLGRLNVMVVNGTCTRHDGYKR